MKGGARDRLREWMKAHPNACVQGYTYRQIAEEIGVSTQWVQMLMPDYSRTVGILIAFQKFLDENPSAVLSKSEGGMTYAQMAERLGWPASRVAASWKALDLPPRNLLAARRAWSFKERCAADPTYRTRHNAWVLSWRDRNIEKSKEINAAARAKYEVKRKALRGAIQ